MRELRPSGKTSAAGASLVLLMALVTVVGVLGAIAARQIVPARRIARQAYQRAVLRNLAEGAIAAGITQLRRGRVRVQRVFADERFGALRGSAIVRAGAAATGTALVAEARLAGQGAEPRPFVIHVRLTRGRAGDWQIVDWRERFAPR